MFRSGSKYLFIIGAPRCGTTAVAHGLGNLPGFFLPAKKEPRFFTDFSERAWNDPKGKRFAATAVASSTDYEALYANAGPDQWRIDASTDYLSNEAAPTRLADFATNHDIRIVCILRDPVRRMFSEYGFCRRMMVEPLDFKRSIEREEERIAEGFPPFFYHVARSRYGIQIKRYVDLFGYDKIKFFIFENYDDKRLIISEICEFVGEKYFKIDYSFSKNESFYFRSEILNNFLYKQNYINSLLRYLIPAGMREKLWKFFWGVNKKREIMTSEEIEFALGHVRGEREAVASLTGLDTSRWSNP